MKRTTAIILAALIALACAASAFAAGIESSKFTGTSVGSTGHFAGYDWVVFKNDGTYAYIITRYLLSVTRFGYNNKYKYSDLRKVINGYENEMKTKYAEEWAYADGGKGYITKHDMSDVFGTDSYEDLLYALSVAEANEVSMDILKVSNWWWLRTPGIVDNYAATVRSDGCVAIVGHEVPYVSDPTRPALQINLQSPIFKSCLFKTAPNGKAAVNEGEGFNKLDNTYNGSNGWKLTVIDKDIPTPKISLSAPASGEAKLIVEYEGARTGGNMYLSALLYDEKDNLIDYAKIAATSGKDSREGEVAIPMSELPNGSYCIKFFSEQINSDSEDDCASAFAAGYYITIPSDTDANITVTPVANLLHEDKLPKSIENVNVTQSDTIVDINLDKAEITGAQNVTEANEKTTLNMTVKYNAETADKETAKFEIQLGKPLKLNENKKLAVFLPLPDRQEEENEYLVLKDEDVADDVVTFTVENVGKYFKDGETVPVTLAEINGDAKFDGENKSSSSGCNAGFGILALFSLAGLFVLPRKPKA